MNSTEGRLNPNGRPMAHAVRSRRSRPPRGLGSPRRFGTALVLCAVIVLLAAACASPDRPVLMESLTVPTAVFAEEAEPTPQPTAETAETAPADSATGECLSDRQWVGQVINVLANQGEIPQVEELAARGEVGGVTVLGTPDATIADALTRLDQVSPIPVMAASDEEGGAVQRLNAIIGPLDPANTQALRSSADVRNEFASYGAAMSELGFDVAFAPVADVGSGPGIGSRSFGSDPAIVAEFAGAVADGFSSAGIQPVFKHFPGHGRATGDSHLGLPTTPPWAEMAAVDLVPYETLLERDDAAVMVGHLIVPGLSDDTPTSLSPTVVNELLRGEDGTSFDGRTFGFDGLVFVDALNMGAITDGFGTTEAAVLALVAGVDVVILGGPSDASPTIDAVLGAVIDGTLTWAEVDSSASRVLTAKGFPGIGRCG